VAFLILYSFAWVFIPITYSRLYQVDEEIR